MVAVQPPLGHAHPSVVGRETSDPSKTPWSPFIGRVELELRGLPIWKGRDYCDIYCPSVRRSPLRKDKTTVQHLDVVSFWKDLSPQQAFEILFWERAFAVALQDAVWRGLLKTLGLPVGEYGYTYANRSKVRTSFFENPNLCLTHDIHLDIDDDLINPMIEAYSRHKMNHRYGWFSESSDFRQAVCNFVRTRDCFNPKAHHPQVSVTFAADFQLYGVVVIANVGWFPPRIDFYLPPTRLKEGDEYRILPELKPTPLQNRYDHFATETTYYVTSDTLPLAWDQQVNGFRAIVPLQKTDVANTLGESVNGNQQSRFFAESKLTATITTVFPAGVSFQQASRYALALHIEPKPRTERTPWTHTYATLPRMRTRNSRPSDVERKPQRDTILPAWEPLVGNSERIDSFKESGSTVIHTRESSSSDGDQEALTLGSDCLSGSALGSPARNVSAELEATTITVDYHCQPSRMMSLGSWASSGSASQYAVEMTDDESESAPNSTFRGISLHWSAPAGNEECKHGDIIDNLLSVGSGSGSSTDGISGHVHHSHDVPPNVAQSNEHGGADDCFVEVGNSARSQVPILVPNNHSSASSEIGPSDGDARRRSRSLPIRTKRPLNDALHNALRGALEGLSIATGRPHDMSTSKSPPSAPHSNKEPMVPFSTNTTAAVNSRPREHSSAVRESQKILGSLKDTRFARRRPACLRRAKGKQCLRDLESIHHGGGYDGDSEGPVNSEVRSDSILATKRRHLKSSVSSNPWPKKRKIMNDTNGDAIVQLSGNSPIGDVVDQNVSEQGRPLCSLSVSGSEKSGVHLSGSHPSGSHSSGFHSSGSHSSGSSLQSVSSGENQLPTPTEEDILIDHGPNPQTLYHSGSVKRSLFMDLMVSQQQIQENYRSFLLKKLRQANGLYRSVSMEARVAEGKEFEKVFLGGSDGSECHESVDSEGEAFEDDEEIVCE